MGKEDGMSRQVSAARRTTFYLGTVLLVAGGLVFASLFFTVAVVAMGGPDTERVIPSFVVRMILAAALLLIGGALRAVGARGLAGSGVILDPQRARRDLEPYARMAGGMVKDALDEAEIKTAEAGPERVVMIRCPSCNRLNEEDSKFCQECGRKL